MAASGMGGGPASVAYGAIGTRWSRVEFVSIFTNWLVDKGRYRGMRGCGFPALTAVKNFATFEKIIKPRRQSMDRWQGLETASATMKAAWRRVPPGCITPAV
jgi:hypothetical protein